MNQYDEIKRLLENSRSMLGKSKLDETRETLIQKGIIQEAVIPNDPTNIEKDIEVNIDNETEPQKDKTQAYRVSGGILKMHGKDQKELELTTDEKVAFQETMDEFVEQVSDLSDFGVLNVYPNNVDWSGKVIDFDLEFYFTIGENSGVYINGDMIKLDTELIELINKHFPDWRRVLNECQRYSASGKIDAGILASFSDVAVNDLIKNLKDKNFSEVRKWVVANLDNDASVLLRRVYDAAYDCLTPSSIPAAVLVIAKYQYQCAFVADQEINMLACLTDIMVECEFK